MVIRKVLILSVILLSAGCYSVRSAADPEEKYCPDMSFEIDSLKTEQVTIYFMRITYSNLSEKAVDFYLRARVSVVDFGVTQYGGPIWPAYLRNLNDLNSTVFSRNER